jgi:hypothetical protein
MKPPASLRPLPIRPGPRPGETTPTYIELLAAANHLPARILRRHLCPPPRHAGRPQLSRLAAVSGRTETALRHALTDLSCAHCGTPLTIRPAGRRPRWCSPACALNAYRRRTQHKPEHRDPASATTRCGYCGTPITRKPRGAPARWCSRTCASRASRKPARQPPTRSRDPADAIPAGNCQHCGTAITRKPRGRPPQWCSSICRLRAYRQRR